MGRTGEDHPRTLRLMEVKGPHVVLKGPIRVKRPHRSEMAPTLTLGFTDGQRRCRVGTRVQPIFYCP